MRIQDVISGKSSQDVVTVSPDATVRDLLGLLAEHNIGALVVSSDGSEVTGIVSERDIVRRLRDGDILEERVSTIMTTSVHTADPESQLDDLMALMTEHRIRHVPVVSGGSLTGIISIGDVVKHRISQLEFERDQLDSYVHQQ
ncbi:CBS domain-containing protein [Nocardioides rotundus]|uniref:CBS domain-containing protein n=1 Tax=Nocardioides rotundus TaxID=1774216 RepID=UPI001CBACEDB|nr:CBS domain-containing protein [Nocardioides rotundus]UAL28505.1 CBS domain-containing protein [Nocardioides rotundus]